jgi:hypothetical protein
LNSEAISTHAGQADREKEQTVCVKQKLKLVGMLQSDRLQNGAGNRSPSHLQDLKFAARISRSDCQSDHCITVLQSLGSTQQLFSSSSEDKEPNEIFLHCKVKRRIEMLSRTLTGENEKRELE